MTLNKLKLNRIFLLLLTTLIAFLIGYFSPHKSSFIKQYPTLYRVVKVIDGDTIKVDIGGEIETVRLTGIDTPEIANSYSSREDYFGPEAARYAKQLMEKRSVYLIPDPMQSNRDKYARLLRYVFLEDGTLINAKLIKEGFAFNYIYEPFQFMKQFDYLEKRAKENRLGLWAGETIESQNRNAASR
ncbi:MAG: thermonuclease family protein [Planctomycetota bacterium]